MAYYCSVYSNAANLIIHDILKDSVPNLDSLIHWYNNIGGIQAAYLAAECYLEDGDITMAQSLMNTISSQYAYAEKYPDQHTAYEQLFDLKILLSQENRSWNNLTSIEVEELETLASDNLGIASVQTQNILHFFYNQTYELPLYLPNSTAPQRLANPRNQISIKPTIELKAYPNPANNFVTFEY